jgi:hypothetical protein
MQSFKDFYNSMQESKTDDVYELISSPIHIGYFLTIKTDLDLFSDEVKVICADNKIDIEQVNIKKLFKRFNKEFN